MKKILNLLLLFLCITYLNLPTSAWAEGFFVCYQLRFTVSHPSATYYDYTGCTTSYLPCDEQKMQHFGEYDDYQSMVDAYKRCEESMPRLVDEYEIVIP